MVLNVSPRRWLQIGYVVTFIGYVSVEIASIVALFTSQFGLFLTLSITGFLLNAVNDYLESQLNHDFVQLLKAYTDLKYAGLYMACLLFYGIGGVAGQPAVQVLAVFLYLILNLVRLLHYLNFKFRK